MPIILGVTFSDGTTERMYIPAEIWRRNPHRVSKLLVFEKGKELSQIIVDPDWETADADIENNYYPRRITPSRVESFKFRAPFSYDRRDIMQEIKTELETDAEKDDENAAEDTDDGAEE